MESADDLFPLLRFGVLVFVRGIHLGVQDEMCPPAGATEANSIPHKINESMYVGMRQLHYYVYVMQAADAMSMPHRTEDYRASKVTVALSLAGLSHNLADGHTMQVDEPLSETPGFGFAQSKW